MQPQRINDPVSASFGPDKPSVTYDVIAQQVKDLKPRALMPAQFDDVIVLIEYMRDQAVKLHDLNVQRHEALLVREQEVTKRERDSAIRARVHDAATRTRSILRYFKR